MRYLSSVFAVVTLLFGIGLAALPAASYGESFAAMPVNYTASASTPGPGRAIAANSKSGPLILSAPPRETREVAHAIYDPIAAYFASVLHRPVEFHYSKTWGGYQADMQAGAYDFVFDGPHFNAWRVAKTGHKILVKIPGEFVYTALVRSNDNRFHSLKELAGHEICAHAPPNLGTLIMYSEFDNPLRQPVVIIQEGYPQIYQALLDGKCDAAMLPLSHFTKYDHGTGHARIIFRTPVMPQQAFSAGPRLSDAEKALIRKALLSPEAAGPLATFSKAYGLGRGLVPASDGEYAGLAKYLKDQWGYY